MPGRGERRRQQRAESRKRDRLSGATSNSRTYLAINDPSSDIPASNLSAGAVERMKNKHPKAHTRAITNPRVPKVETKAAATEKPSVTVEGAEKAEPVKVVGPEAEKALIAIAKAGLAILDDPAATAAAATASAASAAASAAAAAGGPKPKLCVEDFPALQPSGNPYEPYGDPGQIFAAEAAHAARREEAARKEEEASKEKARREEEEARKEEEEARKEEEAREEEENGGV